MKISKINWRVVPLLFVLALLLFLFPGSQHAYADGGAPNLAYVAGASKGISVIDIGQQKVTSSFSMTGDPQMIFLSLDGRFLYVAGNGSASVTALDPNNCAIKRTIKTNGPVYGLTVAIVGSGTSGGDGN